MTFQAVGGICAFQNRTELRIADASLLARRANRARANSDLNNVDTVQYQLLDHLSRHYVSSH